jgi:hypothetical protein
MSVFALYVAPNVARAMCRGVEKDPRASAGPSVADDAGIGTIAEALLQ